MATRRLVDEIGRVLGGRYRLLAMIGSGASARVFLADDVTLERRVAVKLLHPALAHDEAFLRRFRAEARAAAALSHPNVMAVYDWGEEDDGPYLVCEHLAGGSLRDVLDRGHQLSVSQAVLVGLETARGLDYAHRRGLVHRDVKPANLLFDGDGRVRIGDFGVARALAEAAWTEPQGAILGTARYAAPEQVRAVAVDGRTDVYALAIVLIEATTGEMPFPADDAVGTLLARVDQSPDVPASLGPLAPPLEVATRPDPEDRPDAGAFASMLEEAARELPRPEPLPLADPVDVGTAAPRRGPDHDPTLLGVGVTPEAGRRRRRWPLVTLVALLVLGIIATSGYALWLARTPAHPVPAVAGKTETVAKDILRPLRFKVRVSGIYLDNSIPGTVLRTRPNAGQALREQHVLRLVVSLGPPLVDVPDLSNVAQADAEQRLSAQGLKLGRITPRYEEQIGKGTVLEWPHDKRPKGSEIDVVVSAGPPPRVVDNWAGRTYDEAAAAFRAGGLVASRADVFSDTVDPGLIVSTSPAAGTSVDKGGRVTINVSKGPDLVAVPNVVGQGALPATSQLEAAGLQVSNVYGPPNRTVFATDPTPGTRVKKGSSVNLYTR